MRQKINRMDIVFFLLTLFVATAFGAYLALQRVSDPFLYFDIAFVKSIQPQAQMIIPKTGPFASLSLAPGRELLVLQFANMMGIAPEVLQFLPLGTILVALTSFVLARRLLGSSVVACLLTLYVTLNLSHAAALYSIFAYAFVLPIFFGVVIISEPLLERHKPAEILITLLLFVGAHFVHYTIAAWIILFLFGAHLAMWLRRVLAPDKPALKTAPVYYLLLSFVVIYFVFNQVVYESFLPWLNFDSISGALNRFLSYSSVGLSATSGSAFSFERPSVVGLISTVALLMVVVPSVIGILSDMAHLIFRRGTAWIPDNQFVFALGIFVMGIVDSLLYTARGSISTKSFSIVFPFLAILYIQRLGKRALVYGMAALLFMTSLAKIGIFYENSYVISSSSTGSSPERVQPSADWLRTHISRPTYTMLADLNLYGKYLVATTEGDPIPLALGYTPDQFERALGTSPGEWETKPNIMAIDLSSTEPTMGFVFERLAPLRDYAPLIRNNPSLDLIYDDGAIWLARPR